MSRHLSIINRMSEGLRHNIIGNVVGGLILFLILGAWGYLSPSVRLWAKGAFMVLIDFFTYELAIPLWIVCLLPVGWFLFMVKRGPLTKTERGVLVEHSGALKDEGKREPEARPPELNELETKIIAVLASADGTRLTIHQIASQISTNNLRTEQALESLMGNGLVSVARNYVYGNFYFLTSKGRDLAIQLEFA